MNRTSIVTSAIAVAAFGAAVYGFVATRRSETAVAELSRDRNRLTAELRTAQQRAASAEERVIHASEQTAALNQDFDALFPRTYSTATPAAATKAGPGAPSIVAPRAPLVTSMTAPDQDGSRMPRTGFVRGRTFGAPFRGVAPSALESTYHVLYRQLKLSPEQIAQFKAAASEAADRFEELDRQAKQQRVRPTDPSMQPLYLQTEAKLKTKLAEALGTDAMPAIQHFANTLFLREAVVQVANDLFYTPTPLTQPQADQLVEIMWKNMRDPFGNTDPLFADASAMKTEAHGVLSAPQLTVWHTFIDHLAKTSFASLQAPARIRR